MSNAINWFFSRGESLNTDNLRSWGLLIMRVCFGLTLAFGHGLAKLTGFAERAAEFADPLGVGSPFSLGLVVFAEFFCSLLLVAGFFTRGVLIPLIINMAVIVLVIHINDPFRRMELPLLYLAVFVTIFLAGPGRFSLDRLFARK